MSLILSFDILEEEIRKAGGQPTVLEVLWDGDTQGWFLIVNLYTLKRKIFWKEEEVVGLGYVSFGGDERLFSGEVPLWPEAVLMKEWGRRAAALFGLTYYFPSENEPDLDCPNWGQKHLAINCKDCEKLIIPGGSPWLLEELCSECYSLRERKLELQSNSSCDEGVNMYLSNDETDQHVGYCTFFESFAIAPFIGSLVESRMEDKSLNIITLHTKDIEILHSELEAALDTKILNYKKPIIEENKKKFYRLYSIKYKGTEYELMGNFSSEHSEISDLIYSWETAASALAQNKYYTIYFKKGFTKRDDAVLRFINYPCKGAAKASVVIEIFKGILTEEEVMQTIKNLEKNNCLKVDHGYLHITRTGKNIV